MAELPSEAPPLAPMAPRSTWLPAAFLLVPAVFFASRYPLLGNIRLTDIGLLSAYGVPELVLYLVGLVSLFAGYLGSLRMLRGRRFAAVRGFVLTTSAALLLGFGALYPVNAIDLFIYAVRSHLLTTYRLNPNAVEPALFWNSDPYVRFASRQWAETTSPYGPLWNLVSSPATLLDLGHILIAVLILKLLIIASAVTTAWLIYDVVRHERPGEAIAAAVAYLWNPLLLWEGIGNGHNDVIVMLPVVAAVWCWRRGHDRWVIPLLVASALTKYVTALLVPFAILLLWQRRRSWPARLRLAGWSISGATAVAYVALYPFFNIDALRASAESQSGIFLASLGAAAIYVSDLLDLRFPVARSFQIASSALLGLTLLVLLAALGRGRLRFERVVFEAMFALLLLATWNFRPWYIIWLVTLAALLPAGWPLWRTTVWGACALLSYAHYIWIREWWPWDRTVFFLIGIAIAFVPVLAVTVAEIAAIVRTKEFQVERSSPASIRGRATEARESS